jgi:16S rRNA (cytosine1402-N4)-methyltransferase
MADNYHVPVLGHEVCAHLLLNREGVYYDGTLGGGGHAELFLKQLSKKAVYIAVDRDHEAIEYTKKRLAVYNNAVYYKGSFIEFDQALQLAGVDKLDSIFLDLGVSSHQIDDDRRGFAFRQGVNLDMRMDLKTPFTAADILASYNEDELVRIFSNYGEERYSRKIAWQIVKSRQHKAITTSDALVEIINRCVAGRFAVKSCARIFQALRIEVNDELKILEDTLRQSLQRLKKGGRIGVISYHSLEDRIVKNFLREQENPCTCPKEIPYCVCGRKPQMKRIKPYMIVPGFSEIKKNSRARSAKFRVGEKL